MSHQPRMASGVHSTMLDRVLLVLLALMIVATLVSAGLQVWQAF